MLEDFDFLAPLHTIHSIQNISPIPENCHHARVLTLIEDVIMNLRVPCFIFKLHFVLAFNGRFTLSACSTLQDHFAVIETFSIFFRIFSYIIAEQKNMIQS